MLYQRVITSEDRRMIDPTGRGWATIRKFKDTPPTPQASITCKWSREEWLERYICEREKHWRASVHQALIAYDREHDCKYAAQGGYFSLEVLKRSYRNSYRLAGRSVTFKKVVMGVDYLRRIIRTRILKYGYPQPYSKIVTGTSGALPAMLPKGDYLTEAFIGPPHRHPAPNLPGERRQRLKERCINQDANGNVRYLEGYLGAIRKWLKTYVPEYFSSWRNPREYMAPAITKHILNCKFASVEIDFRACDEHFGVEVVQEVVFPILEELTPSQEEFFYYASFIEELFSQPIYFGEEIWEGKHNLLSGQVITNDFETIYDACVQIGTALALEINPESLLILSMGDDQTTIFSGALVRDELPERFSDSLKEEMTMNGFTLAEEKCRISTADTRFTRKVYYSAGPKDPEGFILGSYPTVLMLNNVVNPERMSKDLDECYRSTLQRLDIAYGTYWFTPLIQFVGRGVDWSGFTEDGVNRSTVSDWWERVYDERWSLSNSPSYKLLRKSRLI